MLQNELPSDLIKLAEAARLVGVSPASIWRWLVTGKLPGYKLFGRWRVSKADLLAAYQKGARKPRCQPSELPSSQRQHEAAVSWLQRKGFRVGGS